MGNFEALRNIFNIEIISYSMKKIVIIGIIFVSFLVIITCLFTYFSKQNYSYDKNDKTQYDSENAQSEIENSPTDNINEHEQEEGFRNNNENSFIEMPANLALPFDVEDMGGGNEFVTPFGLIRHERDMGHGHAGIDVPLSKGDNIYAVANGKIIINEPATDGGEGNHFEGNNVILLITEGYREGEGWGFLYEHINLNSGISVGSAVSREQLIGTSALTNGNNHLGLVYYFNDFNYIREPKCWVEHLSDEDKQRLLDAWEEIKNSPKFIESWRNAFEDGAYAYRALLNKDNFRFGPQLCHEYG